MKSWLKRYRIRIFLAVFFGLCVYGFYLSKKTQETKDIVQDGVAAKDATIQTLVIENKEARKEATQAKLVVAAVADSTAVVIQQKQEVIDSLTKKMPNEVPDTEPDTGNPVAVFGYLSTYKPKVIILANGDSIY